MRRSVLPSRAVTTCVCLLAFLLSSGHCLVHTLNDDSTEFLQEYFADPNKAPSEDCVRRMRPCLPWEGECCAGLACTNYAGRPCDYDHEMCVCTQKKSYIEQRDFL